MVQHFKNYKNNLLKPIDLKQKIKSILTIVLMTIVIINIMFIIKINSNIIVFKAIESYTYIITFVISLIFAFTPKTLLCERIYVRIKKYLIRLMSIFLICFFTICLFPYDVVYFMQGEYKTYITEYKITTPGPRAFKHHHCKTGIRIFDEYTATSFFLCFTKNENIQYSNKALVTIKTTPFGSYLSDYKLFIQN